MKKLFIISAVIMLCGCANAQRGFGYGDIQKWQLATDDELSDAISGFNSDNVAYPSTGTFNSPITIQSAFNNVWSVGPIYGFEVTEDIGAGEVDIAEGAVMLRTTDSEFGRIEAFAIPAMADLTMVEDVLNYVYVEYSGGSVSGMLVTQNPFLFIDRTKTVVGQIFYGDGDMHHVTSYNTVDYEFKALSRQADTGVSVAKGSGGVISSASGLSFQITAGYYWKAVTAVASLAYDSTLANFDYFYRDGIGGWTIVSSSAVDNGFYDDGSGTLAALGNNKYTVASVYSTLNTPSHYSVLYGQTEYTALAQAEADRNDSELPPAFEGNLGMSLLIGQIIIQEGQATPENILNYTAVSAQTPSSAVTHNALGGLDGGTISEYFHLTSDEHIALQAEYATSPEGDFTFNSGTGNITGYIGAGGDVILPTSIGGVPVTGMYITAGTWPGTNGITSIVGESIVSITGDFEVLRGDDVTSVSFPNLTTLGQDSGISFPLLETLTLPSLTTTTGYNIYQMDSLIELNLPAMLAPADDMISNCDILYILRMTACTTFNAPFAESPPVTYIELGPAVPTSPTLNAFAGMPDVVVYVPDIAAWSGYTEYPATGSERRPVAIRLEQEQSISKSSSVDFVDITVSGTITAGENVFIPTPILEEPQTVSLTGISTQTLSLDGSETGGRWAWTDLVLGWWKLYWNEPTQEWFLKNSDDAVEYRGASVGGKGNMPVSGLWENWSTGSPVGTVTVTLAVPAGQTRATVTNLQFSSSIDLETIIDDERWANESDKGVNVIEYESEYPGGTVYQTEQGYQSFNVSRSTVTGDADLFVDSLNLRGDQLLLNDGTGTEAFIDTLAPRDNALVAFADDVDMLYNTIQNVGHLEITTDDEDYLDINATGECDIEWVKGTGTGIMDFRILPGDFTSAADYRFGIASGSTGDNRITLFSPNSSTKAVVLSSGDETFFCADDNYHDGVVIGGENRADGDILLELISPKEFTTNTGLYKEVLGGTTTIPQTLGQIIVFFATDGTSTPTYWEVILVDGGAQTIAENTYFTAYRSTGGANNDGQVLHQGFVLPRLHTGQLGIMNPDADSKGMLIYNKTTNKLNFWTGSAWEVVTSL